MAVMLKCVLLIAVVIAVNGEDNESSRLVFTSQGPIRGYKVPEGNIFTFYGIPYATAPVGVHKFKAPLAPPEWTTPFEATNNNIICPQTSFNLDLGGKIQQEDCLIANVFAPDTNETNLPVLVYVHGGAYHIGYSDYLTANELIARRNMIVVNFNYRLGAHGFLCLGTKDAPGNAAMKDQVALLRWVQKNIVSFGGNPHDVTLSGYSAGSSSVDLFLLSPLAKGLFNKVIPESGASLSAFSVQSDPTESAWNFAKLLNFTNEENDIYALESFYKTLSFEDIFSVDVFDNPDSTFYFSPCVERDIGQEMFLDDAPINIIRSGRNLKLPLLFGFTEMEGLFRIPDFERWKERMNQNFSDFLPGDLKFSSIEEKEKVARKVKKFYFGDLGVNEKTILRYIDYFTDTLFAYGTLRSVKFQVESGNQEIYLYEYSFVDENTPFVPYTKVRGADHCAQSDVVGDGFPNPAALPDTEDMKKMKDIMRELWINFITTGKPVPDDSNLPKWPGTDKHGNPHMLLDKSFKLRGPLIQQRVLFWNSIYEQYYRVPVPPTTPFGRQV